MGTGNILYRMSVRITHLELIFAKHVPKCSPLFCIYIEIPYEK